MNDALHRNMSTSTFPEGAVRLVRETGKPIAQVARDLGTLGNWVNADMRRAARVMECWARMSGRSWRGCGGRTPVPVAAAHQVQRVDLLTTAKDRAAGGKLPRCCQLAAWSSTAATG